jgi:mRNA-degrading endonuclease RelE of RelBE toxin-antitoxin system
LNWSEFEKLISDNYLLAREVIKDIKSLGGNERKWLVAALVRLAQNKHGIGKSLSNNQHTKLHQSFELKNKSLGIRMVYRYNIDGKIEMIELIIVGERSDDEVFRLAAARIQKGLRHVPVSDLQKLLQKQVSKYKPKE